jgi:hypothetical protein
MLHVFSVESSSVSLKVPSSRDRESWLMYFFVST